MEAHGNHVDNLVRKVKTVLACLERENLATQFVIRILQRLGYTPLETVDKPVSDTVQLHRRTVASEDELLVVLVQMIENREESLCRTTLVRQLLKVVKQDGIHLLEPVYEIGNLLLDRSVGIEILELSHGDKEHLGTRVTLLYSDTDRLDKVGLADTDVSIKEEGVEVGFLRMVGYMLGDGERELVAAAYAIVLEIQRTVELRVSPLCAVLHRFAGERLLQLILQQMRMLRILDSHLRVAVAVDYIIIVGELHLEPNSALIAPRRRL